MTFFSFLGTQVNTDLVLLREIGLALIILTVAVVVNTWLKRSRHDSEHLTESLPSLPLIDGIRIICGDCSGDATSPQITYMNRSGRCDKCGGDSIMLASDRGIYLRSLLAARMSLEESTRTEARVLPFVKASEPREARVRKIAS